MIHPAGAGSWLAGLLRPIVLAIPTALMLCGDLRMFTAHGNSFVPDPGRLSYYGYCFAVGVVVHRYRGRLSEIFALPLTHLGLSVLTTAVLLTLLPRHLSGTLSRPEQLGLAAVVALQAWLSIFAAIGLALRWCNGDLPAVRYLADASYWVYLGHLPLVGILQLALVKPALPAAVKFLLVLTFTTVLTLLSYHAFGRRKTRLRKLNMRASSGAQRLASTGLAPVERRLAS